MEETMKLQKKGIFAVGLRYFIFAAVVLLAQLICSAVLRKYFPQQLEENWVFLSFLLTILSIYCIGYPVIWSLSKKLPSVKLEEHELGIPTFLIGILYCAGIVGMGIAIGTPLHMLTMLLTGNDPTANTTVTTLMMNSDPFMRILTVGILAPIFEELIFRKVLIDHMLQYGNWVAAVASGLMFGLYHGNFSQCFFAAGLGFFFSYIYIKTGRIRYSIGYHMVINLSTSVITMAVYQKYMSALDQVGMDAVLAGSVEASMQMLPATLLLMGWLSVLFVCALTGIILLIVHRKKFRLREEGGRSFGAAFKTVITNPGILLFFAFCAYSFVSSYLLS